MTEVTKSAEKGVVKTKSKPDPELSAMSRIVKLLNGLESNARLRVASYAVAKAAG